MLWLLLGSRRTGTGSSLRAPVAVAAATSPLRAVLTTEWQLGESSEAGVSVQRLYDLIQPPDEDAFFDEIDALEEEGWLTIRNGRGDDDDLLFPARHGEYDYAAEAAAVEAVADEKEIAALDAACARLEQDPRLEGAWEQACVGCTSADFNTRKGLTGLGGAPFTSPAALFYCYGGGAVCAKEVLRLFGRPERFGDADLGGQRSSKEFAGATATTRPISITGDVASLHCERALSTIRHVCITADGAVRVAKAYAADTQSAPLLFAEATGRCPEPSLQVDAAAGVGAGGYLVYKRLAAGEMEARLGSTRRAAWLESNRLPLVGGTVPTLSMEEMREAYPYLGEGEGAGGDGFAGIKLPWS
ncbi:hypothetical protein EMIHUDRAFT_208404 [Emiliania huxleyi CCMP1516]|uniref:Uncharacterized protein n=2 Tax=Emiliania huxleyi TaxID=2903 RepID=A0A0D3JAH9_EMIH1|nr:hypothetical protein EMIHUDRAFT_208404 [Emiliania huxleyi CCMP1516]EOD20514.1 hypothetical protein EMIHUDRAFT_208404 [Emiliania huxleyi CCMP1516]|eukprot:XP_005772943.1 hypothetical protein EMIHUDRAFT_208404 [Emiliania huxleyi CCMP1516]